MDLAIVRLMHIARHILDELEKIDVALGKSGRAAVELADVAELADERRRFARSDFSASPIILRCPSLNAPPDAGLQHAQVAADDGRGRPEFVDREREQLSVGSRASMDVSSDIFHPVEPSTLRPIRFSRP